MNNVIERNVLQQYAEDDDFNKVVAYAKVAYPTVDAQKKASQLVVNNMPGSNMLHPTAFTMLTKAPSQAAMQLPFIAFVDANRDALLGVFSNGRIALGSLFNQSEWRGMKSEYYCSSLEKAFSGQLIKTSCTGYDLLHRLRYKDDRISLKTQDTDLFPYLARAGNGYTDGRDVVLKNCLGGPGTVAHTSDYILIVTMVFPKNTQGQLVTTMGVFPTSALTARTVKKNDQVKYKIDVNDAASIYVGYRRFDQNVYDRFDSAPEAYRNSYIRSMVDKRMEDANTLLGTVR